MPNDLTLFDDLMWITTHTYVAVHRLEEMSFINHQSRLTDPEFDLRSPRFTKFSELIEPELVEVRKRYDPALFEEAKRISLWKDLLQKIADLEGDVKDISFLKLPFFRPTLLSLQAKFQNQMSSVDGSDGNNSLSAHLKQESLQIVALLHSLLTSPLPPSLPTRSPSNRFDSRLRLPQYDTFIDRTVSALGTSDSLIRVAALSLFDYFVTTSYIVPLLHRLLNRLHSAFRDGTPEERCGLILISTTWIAYLLNERDLPSFPATLFDWEGLIAADLNEPTTFIYAILLILLIRHRSIKDQIGKATATHIILSFERNQRGVSRIVILLNDIQRYTMDIQYSNNLISYSRRPFFASHSVFSIRQFRFSRIVENDVVNAPRHHSPNISKMDTDIANRCLSLEWLNIPTGFGSALAHSYTSINFDSFQPQDNPHTSPYDSLNHTRISTLMPDFLPRQVNKTRSRIRLAGSLSRELNHAYQSFYVLQSETIRLCLKELLTPVPAEVSVFLEFVKRFVFVGSEATMMEMARFGMQDIVIRAVSESSFLEDYENGICVIGILLRSIRDFEKNQEMADHDFSRLLSPTEVE
ncbi:hypothetical protein BLNAU_22769 [Blattamonas nauphoetae]|uniref:Uncharacterized protein n=1 Tax=Blattamonas nauphoetae TaxID=2049346 RepID=A0ABQ9WS48_9EUKA|nr:hypothetical protein BLNAU_22769 [Blattamonas nauphoetae]